MQYTAHKPLEVISWNANDGAFASQKVQICELVQNAASKEIQIIMPKDALMKEHKAPFAISVQVLSGRIWFEVGGERVEMGALDMVCLDADVAHSLGGLADSVLRLSLAKADDTKRINAVLGK